MPEDFEVDPRYGVTKKDIGEDIYDFDYTPPDVRWEPITKRVEREDKETGKIVVEDEVTGHRVEPNYDDSWDELTKLRWFAALIGNRTGVQARVAQRDGEDSLVYLVSTRHMESADGAPYEVTWAWLSGLECGILEGRFPA